MYAWNDTKLYDAIADDVETQTAEIKMLYPFEFWREQELDTERNARAAMWTTEIKKTIKKRKRSRKHLAEKQTIKKEPNKPCE